MVLTMEGAHEHDQVLDVAQADRLCLVIARAFSPYDRSRVLTQAVGLGWYGTRLWRSRNRQVFPS
jgi:hypothetical protein